MCGIAGLVGDFVPGLIDRMNAAQAHRGPDGCGVFESPRSQVALGHVRLAVLDLSELAAQPMTSADGRFTLIFNGEIYNYRELRSSLAGSGPALTSTGDTQVLLHGLMRWGPAFVERLNGMFTFAFWDDRERELLLRATRWGSSRSITPSRSRDRCCLPARSRRFARTRTSVASPIFRPSFST